MFKTYYRNEYTEKQWRALIDAAHKYGCTVTYGRYGDRAEIDSTERETALLRQTGPVAEGSAVTRDFWAKHIHRRIQEATDLRRWKVLPKRYRKGYCPTICRSERTAEYERELLELETGFEWKIIIIPE